MSSCRARFVPQACLLIDPGETQVNATSSEGSKPAFELLRDGGKFASRDEDPEQREYAVLVDWLDTLPTGRAFNEIGLFGNQNTVCQPRTPRWRHTVERLKTVFSKWDGR